MHRQKQGENNNQQPYYKSGNKTDIQKGQRNKLLFKYGCIKTRRKLKQKLQKIKQQINQLNLSLANKFDQDKFRRPIKTQKYQQMFRSTQQICDNHPQLSVQNRKIGNRKPMFGRNFNIEGEQLDNYQQYEQEYAQNNNQQIVDNRVKTQPIQILLQSNKFKQQKQKQKLRYRYPQSVTQHKKIRYSQQQSQASYPANGKQSNNNKSKHLSQLVNKNRAVPSSRYNKQEEINGKDREVNSYCFFGKIRKNNNLQNGQFQRNEIISRSEDKIYQNKITYKKQESYSRTKYNNTQLSQKLKYIPQINNRKYQQYDIQQQKTISPQKYNRNNQEKYSLAQYIKKHKHNITNNRTELQLKISDKIEKSNSNKKQSTIYIPVKHKKSLKNEPRKSCFNKRDQIQNPFQNDIKKQKNILYIQLDKNQHKFQVTQQNKQKVNKKAGQPNVQQLQIQCKNSQNENSTKLRRKVAKKKTKQKVNLTQNLNKNQIYQVFTLVYEPQQISQFESNKQYKNNEELKKQNELTTQNSGSLPKLLNQRIRLISNNTAVQEQKPLAQQNNIQNNINPSSNILQIQVNSQLPQQQLYSSQLYSSLDSQEQQVQQKHYLMVNIIQQHNYQKSLKIQRLKNKKKQQYSLGKYQQKYHF